MSSWAHVSLSPNRYTCGSSVFAQNTRVPNIYTDYVRYCDIGSNRPRLLSRAMRRCGLKILCFWRLEKDMHVHRLTSLCLASYLGSQHDATRSCSSRSCSYRSIFAASARSQQQTSRPTGQTDRQTLERYIDPAPHRLQRQQKFNICPDGRP